MVKLQSKWRYLFMFLGVQLVVMALLSREGYQKRVTYFIRIFRKSDGAATSSRNQTAANVPGSDVYANLSLLSRGQNNGEVVYYCPKTSPLTVGPIHVSFPSGLTLADVQRKNPLVVRGGRYRPPDCEARHRTAIVIPHRHREHHLRFLLYYLHPFLQRQQLNYGIYVIHQIAALEQKVELELEQMVESGRSCTSSRSSRPHTPLRKRLQGAACSWREERLTHDLNVSRSQEWEWGGLEEGFSFLA
ncbi:beta-1,4-galactosyltransferase 3-like [Entelurus aequoreus]|uniref:beta-1,4-galactosyltransferase 3-like n=1 Tax=Entelurus aequoreus TaxID=161455 RepID=UPI002B1D79B6|nr:beta-1,4-galactosyltransferase 3-like [Entelurus aequoreus]